MNISWVVNAPNPSLNKLLNFWRILGCVNFINERFSIWIACSIVTRLEDRAYVFGPHRVTSPHMSYKYVQKLCIQRLSINKIERHFIPLQPNQPPYLALPNHVLQ